MSMILNEKSSLWSVHIVRSSPWPFITASTAGAIFLTAGLLLDEKLQTAPDIRSLVVVIFFTLIALLIFTITT